MQMTSVSGAPAPFQSTSQGSPLFQVRHLVTDLAVVGRHIVGDVTVELEARQGVDLQVQWATLVAAATGSADDVEPRQEQQQQQLNASNSSFDLLHTQLIPTQRYYLVPIVGQYLHCQLHWCWQITRQIWLTVFFYRKQMKLLRRNCKRRSVRRSCELSVHTVSE